MGIPLAPRFRFRFRLYLDADPHKTWLAPSCVRQIQSGKYMGGSCSYIALQKECRFRGVEVRLYAVSIDMSFEIRVPILDI